MKGVILAAGKGTRMLPLTERRPKPLVPILERPMLEHIVCGARDAGFDHLCLIVAYKGEQIVEHFGDGSRLGMKIEYIWQEGPAGTGAATLMAEDFVAGEPFFLSWGDIIVGPQTYHNVARVWEQERPEAILSLNWVEDPCEGAAVYVEDGCISRIVEKPTRGTSTTNYNNAGIFVFRPELFDILKGLPDSPRGEKEMPDAVKVMMEAGKRIRGLEVEGYWSDVARPATVLQLNATMMLARYEGGVSVDPTAVVDSAAELIGPVYVGPGCHVAGARLGPGVTLRAGARVGEGACLEHCALWEGAGVGQECAVRHAILEEKAVLNPGLALTGDECAPAVMHKV